MGKKPSFQFYPGDWRRDTQVQMASMETRGVWIEMLCCMWEAPERGKLAGLENEISRMLGCSPKVFKRSLEEIERLRIAEVKRDISVTCHAMSQNGYDFVTVINRRMYREEKDREKARLRKQKQRAKNNVPPESRTFHKSISSSSSRDILSYDNISPGGDHFSQKIGDYLDSILEASKTISKLLPKKKPFNPFQWVQFWANQNGHPKAILESLQGLIGYWDQSGIDNPWSYANSIMATKNGNYNEREHIRESERFKEMLLDPKVKQLIDTVLKGS